MYRELVPALKKRRYRQGWWAGELESYESYKTVIDDEEEEEEEEETRTMEAKYKGELISLLSSFTSLHSIHIK
jgi:hypothetical protein